MVPRQTVPRHALHFSVSYLHLPVLQALQRTEVQILSEILENTKASNATTSEQLDILKESVDTLQKEISEFENKKSKN